LTTTNAAHLNLESCSLDDNSCESVLKALKKVDLLQSVTKLTLDSNQLTKVPSEIVALE
jgi:Leucine-rich repeat (LRR) protein